MDKKAALAGLKRTMAETLKAFSWSPKVLSRSYAPGKWTGIQILAHLTHCELVFLTRIHFLLAEENPVIVPFDQDAWMKRFTPKASDLKPTAASFKDLRSVFIEFVKGLAPADPARRGRHPENPDYTLEYLVVHSVEHNEHHLEQLKAIKAGKRWVPTPTF